MNPSSAIALVSAMLGLWAFAFSALEMASLLAAQQNSRTATLAAANAPLNHIPLTLFLDRMQSPSLASATEQRPAVALLSYPALRVPNFRRLRGIVHPPFCRTRAVVVEPDLPFDPHLRPRSVRSMACW